MAGSYPDAPGRRMGWDNDGSVLLEAAQSNFAGVAGTPPSIPYTLLSLANAELVNDESYTTVYGSAVLDDNTGHFITLLFPEKRELDGLYGAHDIAGGADITNEAYSTNTTNGMDGTWTDLTLGWFALPAADSWRDDITTYAVSNVKGLMFTIGADDIQRYRMLHIYGAISPGETPDRLLFLDPGNSDLEFTKPLDFGDVPRGQTQVDTFKVRNNSGSLTANTVQVTAEDLFDGSSAWYTYSLNNITFSATLALGNIGPGSSQLVYVKQIVPSLQTPGVYAARTKLTVASWT